MEDEEMAEERKEKYGVDLCCYCRECDEGETKPCQHKIDAIHGYKDGFLAGLKAGRPQWHDLRKDKNDLPDEGYYLVVWQNARGYRERMIMEYEEDNDDEALHWIDGDGDCWDNDVIAWCEIPTFDKE